MTRKRHAKVQDSAERACRLCSCIFACCSCIVMSTMLYNMIFFFFPWIMFQSTYVAADCTILSAAQEESYSVATHPIYISSDSLHPGSNYRAVWEVSYIDKEGLGHKSVAYRTPMGYWTTEENVKAQLESNPAGVARMCFYNPEDTDEPVIMRDTKDFPDYFFLEFYSLLALTSVFFVAPLTLCCVILCIAVVYFQYTTNDQEEEDAAKKVDEEQPSIDEEKQPFLTIKDDLETDLEEELGPGLRKIGQSFQNTSMETGTDKSDLYETTQQGLQISCASDSADPCEG